MSILDKLHKPSQEVHTGDFQVVDDPWEGEYPGIHELLSRNKYKGKARKSGRLILYCEPGRATLVCIDRDSEMVCFYAAAGFSEALEGLEGALQAGSCDWRPDKKAPYRK